MRLWLLLSLGCIRCAVPPACLPVKPADMQAGRLSFDGGTWGRLPDIDIEFEAKTCVCVQEGVFFLGGCGVSQQTYQGVMMAHRSFVGPTLHAPLDDNRRRKKGVAGKDGIAAVHTPISIVPSACRSACKLAESKSYRAWGGRPAA